MKPKSILPQTWDVPQIFRDRLGAKVGRQRCMKSDGHLLLVLHVPPKPDEDERLGRFFWRKPDGSWTSNDLGTGTNALSSHVQQYADRVEKLDRMEEVATSAEDYFEVLEPLAPLQRAARNLHQVLQEARKSCPEDREIIDLRDRAYEVERATELLYSGAKNGLDFAVARRAEEQARSAQHMAVSAHRLNLLACFFFPIATLSSIFGVNLLHGWEEAKPPGPFLTVMFVGLVCGFVLTLFISKPTDHGNSGKRSP